MPPDASRKAALMILRERDPALADEIEELLTEAPVERLLRQTLERNGEAVETALERLVSEMAALRKGVNITVIVALVLQAALVLGSLSVQIPGLHLITNGTP